MVLYQSIDKEKIIDHLEEKYYQSLSDSELLELRDTIPTFKERYDDLVNEVLDFCKGVDVDAIENGIEQIKKYRTYKSCLKGLKEHNLYLNKMNDELAKAFFFKKKYFKDQIVKCNKIIKEIKGIIQECENDEAFIESFKINQNRNFYWQERHYLDNSTSDFEKSFQKLYNNEIKILNNNFKSIYYRIDKFEISEKNNPKHIFDTWEHWEEDYKKYNHKFITVRDKFRFRFSVKIYPYLTRWDLKYFPYFLGKRFQNSPSYSIKIIDKILLSRNNDDLINHLREQNET